MTRGRYTCFFHPKEDMTEHELSDPCPECGRPYGYPLEAVPDEIGDFRIEKALGRGFYAATYLATYGSLRAEAVLKVTPEETYTYFGKDFDAESQLHLEVSQGTQHLARIINTYKLDVEFGDMVIPCHVAHLEFVKGPTLGKFLSDPANRTARKLAQVTVDLFSLMQELLIKQRYHNDLHDRNIIIQPLDRTNYRSGDAIEPGIRAVAVDLGSLAEMSRSVPADQRLGDLLQIVRHILEFRNMLLDNPEAVSDMDYRLAVQLDLIGHLLAPGPLTQREPSYDELAKQILEGYGRSTSPWKAPMELRAFSESYNAQTLHPAFVRRLLVDPDDEWLTTVSAKGPQVITGIRGCGKTMLLKALQSHSQISHHWENSDNAVEAISKIKQDGYIGLYVPTNRLLDTLGSSSPSVHEPYVRLFVAYAWEALRAARHLSELAAENVSPTYWRYIGEAVVGYVKGTSGLEDVPTELALENELFNILVSLDRGESFYALEGSPAVAFPALAEAVRRTSDVWSDATVLFLLDDVSTRNLSESDIGRLLGTLLFAHPHCAFKMTTEVQTMELLLKSPGLIETARVGRDYDTFDLSARVVDKLNDSNGSKFVEEILTSRADFYPRHPSIPPSQLLGNDSLKQIAEDIATTSDNAPKRKGVYRGIKALTSLCVGDIGDILKIYEAIISRYDEGSPVPIPYETQSGEFQEYCSKQLYHLNRRGGELKDFALSFAKAAHDLLVKSATAPQEQKRGQLRQYTQMYVHVTTGDTDWQFKKLLELIDAGVFVLRGGPDVPRTKTRDANPTQNFILTYRKLYGLSSYIGLSHRDRFELSGEDLIAWLKRPEEGAKILGRNLGLGNDSGDDNQGQVDDPGLSAEDTISPTNGANQSDGVRSGQLPMLMQGRSRGSIDRGQGGLVENEPIEAGNGNTGRRLPVIDEIADIEDLRDSIATVVTSLGFEERAKVSSKRLFSKIRPQDSVLIRYPDPGHAEVIRAEAQKASARLHEIKYDAVNENTFELPEGEVVVDVTGLAKPVIFKVVSEALKRDRTLVVAHTSADVYYPLDKDIEPILASGDTNDMFSMLESAQEIWTGEKGPYKFIPLLTSDVDQARRRLLCAAVSPQHERLLSLVNGRDYDELSIIEPDGDTPRARLAKLAAKVAMHGRFGLQTNSIDSDDLIGMVELLGTQVDEFYIRGQFDVEFSLTGSKMHAVACAAASVVRKISQCWYVEPTKFDNKRFTEGAKQTRFYRISLPDHFENAN